MIGGYAISTGLLHKCHASSNNTDQWPKWSHVWYFIISLYYTIVNNLGSKVHKHLRQIPGLQTSWSGSWRLSTQLPRDKEVSSRNHGNGRIHWYRQEGMDVRLAVSNAHVHYLQNPAISQEFIPGYIIQIITCYIWFGKEMNVVR